MALCLIFASIYFLLCLPVMDILYKLLPLHDQIVQQSLGFLYDIQISLLTSVIGTLAIVTSFLDKRYLGASFKYWFFNGSVFYLAPQDVILLMSINQIGGLISEITGQFRAMALLNFGVCWGLFLHLTYQVYVYSFKMSRVFYELRCRLTKAINKSTGRKSDDKKEEWEDICELIYKKIWYNKLQNDHNSYLFEEIELIIQVLLSYRKFQDHHQDYPERIKTISKVMVHMLEQDSRICAGLTDDNPNSQDFNDIMTARVIETINKGNEIRRGLMPPNDYEYLEALSAKENLFEALKQWCSLPEEEKD